MNVWLGLGKEKSFFVLKRLIEGWQETWCHDAWETHKPGFKSCLLPFFCWLFHLITVNSLS